MLCLFVFPEHLLSNKVTEMDELRFCADQFYFQIGMS